MFFRVLFFSLIFPLWCFSQEPEFTIQLGHNKLIYDVAFSANGNYVASASADRTVKVWDVASGKELKKLRIDNGYATSVDFHPSKNLLLIGGGDYDHGELLVWDYEQNVVIHDLDLHKEYAWKARYSPDGSKILCTSFDGSYSI